MKWSNDELHWASISIQIRIFKTFVECFKRTAPGVRYYVNCTEEQDAESHTDLAKKILKALRTIKKSDIGAYKTLVVIFEDDIRDAITVYRQSKAEA